jgi:hypothetical protein
VIFPLQHSGIHDTHPPAKIAKKNLPRNISVGGGVGGGGGSRGSVGKGVQK